MATTEWNIQTRATACQQCGGPFVDGGIYHTVLVDHRTEYSRRDICQACWEGGARDQLGAEAGFVSHWQGVFEVPPPPTELIRKETADELLRKLVELNDPSYLASMFILAVMLERKRQLRVKDQLQRDGRRVFVYEQVKTGDVFTITDPGLGLDQLEQVQHDVARLLEHGLEPAASAVSESRSQEPASAAVVPGEPNPTSDPVPPST